MQQEGGMVSVAWGGLRGKENTEDTVPKSELGTEAWRQGGSEGLVRPQSGACLQKRGKKLKGIN